MEALGDFYICHLCTHSYIAHGDDGVCLVAGCTCNIPEDYDGPLEKAPVTIESLREIIHSIGFLPWGEGTRTICARKRPIPIRSIIYLLLGDSYGYIDVQPEFAEEIDYVPTFAKRSELKRKPPAVSLAKRFRIMARDKFTCKYCGRSPATHSQVVLRIDHINPRANDGDNNDENLITSCQDCNAGKGAKLLDSFEVIQ